MTEDFVEIVTRAIYGNAALRPLGQLIDLEIARRRYRPAEIRFNSFAQGQPAGNMERADMSGPGGANAVPLVVANEVGSQPAFEAASFADKTIDLSSSSVDV